MTRRLSLPVVALALFSLGCYLPASAVAAGAWTLTASSLGGARLELDGKEVVTIVPGLFEAPWKSASMGAGKVGDAAQGGKFRGQIRAPGGIVTDVEWSTTASGSGVRLLYKLTPQSDIKLNALYVGLSLPAGTWAGGKYSADGTEGALPAQFKQVQIRTGQMKSLRLTSNAGSALQIDLAAPTAVLLQDDRQWGETLTARIGPQFGNGEIWPKGKSLELGFTLGAEGGVKYVEDGPVTIQAGADWLPLDWQLEIEPGSALDFSQVIPHEAPAGKSGRVIANAAGKFAFAQRPQVPVRFYGVNLCFSAQYLEHAQADQLAERLLRLGYNAVRIHHYEGELVERTGGGVRLRADKLDQFDYLFSALKQRGIYVTTDLFVSRPVGAAEIYPGESGDIGMDNYKMAVHVNDRAFANYQSFITALLGHVNPYTKLRYAGDPALAWLSLVNEDCPGNFTGQLKGPLHDEWQRKWNLWLVQQHLNLDDLKLPAGQDPAKGSVPMPDVHANSPITTLFNVFLAEVESDFVARTRRFLREEMKCEALLTDLNAWTNPYQLQAVRGGFDYVDDHFYVDHPQFLEKPWSLPSRCPNTSPIAGGATGGRNTAFTRLYGKPFTITEFNYSAPGRYRGVGGILTGALGAVQDWDGVWRFAYAHDRQSIFKPAPMDYFNVGTDPLNQAAERASLCLFLRGDLQAAPHAVVIDATRAELLEQPKSSRDKTPAWHGLAWTTRVGWTLDGKPAVNNALTLPAASTPGLFDVGTGKTVLDDLRAKSWLPSGNLTDLAQNRFQSETGEITIDSKADTLTLDTPRTAGGYAPVGAKINTRAATIEILETGATVWVSSLDDQPITRSKRLLITHLTDLQNAGTRYADRSQQVLLSWGGLPHLVHAGAANLTLLRDSSSTRLKVYSLATNGKREAEVPVKSGGAKGSVQIPLTVANAGKARMLYEVVVE